MIVMPNRLEQAVAQLERGEPVDWNRLASLQSLDLVIAGRKFVEEAIQEHERADAAIEQQLTAPE